MHDRYEPAEFEQKWRDRWEAESLFATKELADRPKFYGLDFFPYPSGAGLSVGHCRNYIPTDTICRMKRMQGFNVLHPMGFDAFGLPAENEAIKNKVHPAGMIDKYAANYKRQMDLIGISYDWNRSFKSSDPGYYRWTQWIFKLLHEKGLAYRREAEVNWCPKDKTALANEEVVGGLCERCGTPVEKKAIPQWFFRITEYAQRLIDDLDKIDWPEGIKQQQRNWIGRSEGVEFEMQVVETASEPQQGFVLGELDVVQPAKTFRVFTTRIDTIFGMTFCVLAPEHPLVEHLKRVAGPDKATEIEQYQVMAKSLTDADRQLGNREKTGVFTGAYALNPATEKPVPIWVADYVLTGYGTGAIMAVPAHDQRDFEFATKFGLDITPVFEPNEAYFSQFPGKSLDDYLADAKAFDPVFETKGGTLVNSGEFSGKDYAAATESLCRWVEAEGFGERKVNYKLRDWLISRQRYWGCPIPVVYDKDGNIETVPDDALPVMLPPVENYEPSDDGSSPLSRITDFVNATTNDGTLGRRETDTMGGFACSSWYFLRFCDPFNEEKVWDIDKVKYWMPVDCYVGGAEHAVMHLLYARFWTKVLFDAGLVPVDEPFQRLMNQGQVLGRTPYRKPRADEKLDLGEDGVLLSYAEAAEIPENDVTWRWVRMSKSKGNIVTPDEAVAEFGADALRLFELFVAPFDQNVEWSNAGMQGTSRFLSRVFRWAGEVLPTYGPDWHNVPADSSDRSSDIRRATHQLVKKASEDIERFSFNTYVAAMMETLNKYQDIAKTIKSASPPEMAAWSEALEAFVLILSPAAPHTADEIWEAMGKPGFTLDAHWPQYREDLAKEDSVTIAVQVNGKLRDTMEAAVGTPKEELERLALASTRVAQFTAGLTVRKVIVVPDKLVNIVAN